MRKIRVWKKDFEARSILEVQAWEPSTAYAAGDLVFHRGHFYEAITDHMSESTFDVYVDRVMAI